MKRLLAILLALVMMVSVAVIPVSANDGGVKTPAEEYPWVLIHGFLGWGSYDMLDKILPHTGLLTGDVEKTLENNGYTVVKPSVGPLSSAWDRACEMYAQLTGTRVDYGEAHSKECGHDRYGLDYTGRGLLGNYTWDAEHKLNLLGHSFGGATERTFVDMLADGRPEEVEAAKAAGTPVSPLFEGGKGDWIYSVTMFAAPSNGSTCPESSPFVRDLITGFVKGVTEALDIASLQGVFDSHLEHFGIYKDDNETILQGVTRVLNSDFESHNDSALADLWVDRATDMNKELQLQPNIYYQSYYGCTTMINPTTQHSVPTDRMWALFYPMALDMGRLNTVTKGSYQYGYGEYEHTVQVAPQHQDETWQATDGMVNTISGYCPFRLDAQGNRIYDKHVDYVEGMEVQPGQWYVMPMQDVDHVGFVGGFLNENPDAIHGLYLEAIQHIDTFANSGSHDCLSSRYEDLSTTAWYHTPVDYVLGNGFMAGMSDRQFSPGSNVSRAQLCQILYAAAGKPSASDAHFNDVQGDEWFADAVNWCSSKGIAAGFEDGSFRPYEDVTREQLAVILRSYTKSCHNSNRNMMIHASLNPYRDKDEISSWASDAMGWAVGKKILAGRGGMMLAPKATATRAEIAQMITSFNMQVVTNRKYK